MVLCVSLNIMSDQGNTNQSSGIKQGTEDPEIDTLGIYDASNPNHVTYHSLCPLVC